jgi:TorA maturation chaperone TorD/DNA-binding transcriptional regulator YdaS (Cro superfamily)
VTVCAGGKLHILAEGNTLREEGLQKAIDAAGGVAALARILGIAQPSVSGWTRVPADRVAAIESATGVSRAELRPDLFASEGEVSKPIVDEIDLLRASEYGLLAVLLGKAPDAALLKKLATLRGDSTEMGLARVALGDAAAKTDETSVSREYFDLFIGVGRGELLPYGSWYQTGFLHERPLARVRADLERMGIERAGERAEPEDHIAILCDVMAGMARGEFANGDLGRQKQFFEAHVKPWALRFFADLETVKRADFYRSVGLYGRLFFELESEAFALPDEAAA